MSGAPDFDRECCAAARGPHLTSAYRCGQCDVCEREGIAVQVLDADLSCGFFCDCMPGFWTAFCKAEAQRAVSS